MSWWVKLKERRKQKYADRLNRHLEWLRNAPENTGLVRRYVWNLTDIERMSTCNDGYVKITLRGGYELMCKEYHLRDSLIKAGERIVKRLAELREVTELLNFKESPDD